MKTSLEVIFEILRLFGNMLIADHMYSRNRWEKFWQPVETLLSQKQKTFSERFVAFLQLTENSVHFEKKGQLHGLNISEFIDHERCSYFNTRKLLF